MKKIFITVANTSGTIPLIRELKEEGFEVHVGDMNPDAIGRFFADHFSVLPPQKSDEYIQVLLTIVKNQKIDVLIPAGELECLKIAQEKTKFEALGCTPIVTNLKTLEIALEKIDSYDYLVKNTDIPFMRYHRVESLDDLEKGLIKFKECPKLSLKPSQGSGSRGFTILDDTPLDAESYFNRKSSFTTMSINDLKSMLKHSKNIPTLILMEHLEGVHYDSNLICKNGEILFQSVKTREETINGTITKATMIVNEKIYEMNRKIAKSLNVDGYIMIQYIGDKLVEINPRWSTSVNYKNINEYIMAIKLALGEKISISKEEQNEYIGVKFIRYFDTFAYKNIL